MDYKVCMFEPDKSVIEWAMDNCHSLISYEVVDVSDLSMRYDEIGEFVFGLKEDAEKFKKQWITE